MCTVIFGLLQCAHKDTSSAPYRLRCSVAPRVCGTRFSCLQRSILVIVVLSPLRLPPANCIFPDGARHPFAAVYIDGARSVSLWVRAALANRSRSIQRVYGCHVSFGPDPLKSMAVHKAQRNAHRQIQFYVHKMFCPRWRERDAVAWIDMQYLPCYAIG